MVLDVAKLQWTRAPKDYTISSDKVEIITLPHED